MEKSWKDVLFFDKKEEIKEHFSRAKDLLLIIGKGFDPRELRTLELLKPISTNMTIWLVDYTDPNTVRKNENNESKSCENYKGFLQMSQGLAYEEVPMPMYHGNTMKKTLVISESVRTALKPEKLACFQNIAVDISAMPRGVGFSIVKRLLDIKTMEQRIHILVCENSEYDDRIKPTIVDESAEYLLGFNTFSMAMEQNDEDTVWFPLLGLHEERAFNIISNYLKPVEICPVIPFPSVDIRRGENILRSCGSVLFQEHAIERRNIIYVPENYPLLIYEKLYDTVRYYEKVFATGQGQGKKYAFSSQSSKLMDIGLLLAVIDLNRSSIKDKVQ